MQAHLPVDNQIKFLPAIAQIQMLPAMLVNNFKVGSCAGRVLKLKSDTMNGLTLDDKVTLKEAYLIMFDYLNHYWEETGRPDEIGNVLSELQLWDTSEGKQPIDVSIFPQWLACAKNILEQEQTNIGYRSADIKLKK